jgi:hypothetical protein
MWFALDQGFAPRDGVEQMLLTLEAISQFAGELRRRLAGDGVDGIEGAFALYRRLGDTLGDIPLARLEEMHGEIARVERSLGDILGRLEDLRRVKRALA